MIALSGGAKADTFNNQNWPSRPIKLIVPTGPGAATDVMARLVADGVSRTLGQAMFVENVPGASGILAHETAARAAPDGYTLLFTNTSGMAINLISFKQLPYDPTRDFTAVAVVCNLAPQMLSVNEALPVTTVAELIAYAKAHPGKLSIASTTLPVPRRSAQSCSTSAPASTWSKCRIGPARKWSRTSPAASTR
ncbi:MAG TPA: tripartite tricarboxylate transporter substrate binding protein [Xanthobacteraceae bacterium]|nr:tripartite tricarboxylate transporter substrate binding protein [Xanthobacteraceae bacterium]